MAEILITKYGLDLVDGDKELYRELLGYYINDNLFDVKEFEDAVMKSNTDGASYIHRIKGASRQIAAEQVSAKGQEIEDILRGKAQGNLAPLLNEFVELYQKTLGAVKAWLSQTEDN